MILNGSRTLYTCEEHGEVSIPLDEVLSGNVVDIYPEVTERGYFDIEFKRGRLELRATRFVGLIPLNDSLAVHVKPKAPIANLLYMIWRSGTRLHGLAEYLRGYAEQAEELASPEALYVAAFTSAMTSACQSGLLKRYETRVSSFEKRGRLLFGPTVKCRARGINHRHVFRITDLTADNRENQTVKRIAERLLQFLASDATGDNKQAARALHQLLRDFDHVDSGAIHEAELVRSCDTLIRALPRHNRGYEPVLWLAYLIASRRGVSMERFGAPRFETVMIDVSRVFERYIRQLCREAIAARASDGWRVVDGNRKPVPFFIDGHPAETRPDIYFERGTDTPGVVDAKYKARITVADRYEMLAFCESLGASRAVFACPRLSDQVTTEHLGNTRSGVCFQTVRVDLAAPDLTAAESRFQAETLAALALS